MFGASDQCRWLAQTTSSCPSVAQKIVQLQAAGRDQTYVAPAQSLLVCMQACKGGGGGKQFVWEGSGAGFSIQF